MPNPPDEMAYPCMHFIAGSLFETGPMNGHKLTRTWCESHGWLKEESLFQNAQIIRFF